MTPRGLFAVLVGIIGVSYLASFVTMLLSIVTGPFAGLVVGLILMLIARQMLRRRPEEYPVQT